MLLYHTFTRFRIYFPSGVVSWVVIQYFTTRTLINKSRVQCSEWGCQTTITIYCIIYYVGVGFRYIVDGTILLRIHILTVVASNTSFSWEALLPVAVCHPHHSCKWGFAACRRRLSATTQHKAETKMFC